MLCDFPDWWLDQEQNSIPAKYYMSKNPHPKPSQNDKDSDGDGVSRRYSFLIVLLCIAK
jgi:hypothetical protein